MNELTAVDLFSGLGAWAIAGHAAGIRTLCFVEKDQRCQDFLGKAWPGITIHGDIKTFDGKAYYLAHWAIAKSRKSQSSSPEPSAQH